MLMNDHRALFESVLFAISPVGKHTVSPNPGSMMKLNPRFFARQTTSPPRTFPTTPSVVPLPTPRVSRPTGKGSTVVNSPTSSSGRPS